MQKIFFKTSKENYLNVIIVGTEVIPVSKESIRISRKLSNKY